MKFISDIQQLIKASKGFEMKIKCIEPTTNQFSLCLTPVPTKTGQKTGEVESIEHHLNRMIRITGTPQEIDEVLETSIGQLTEARIEATSNLDSVLEGLKQKPASKKKPQAKKVSKTPMLDNANEKTDSQSTKNDTTQKATDTQKRPVKPRATKAPTTQEPPQQVQMF